MKSLLPVVVVALLVATILLPGTRSKVSASPNATADTLKQLEGEFMKAAAEKGSKGYMSFYADDAVEVPNGSAVIQGKANIAPGMSFLDDKNNQLLWTPVGAGISGSGDLGYTYGTYGSIPKIKTAKPASNTASTPASGSCRKMEAGR